jgi:hypothetical protein
MSRVKKVLVINPVCNTIDECLRMQNEVEPYLGDLVVDITVVRECMTGFEQMAIVNFSVLLIFESVEHVSPHDAYTLLRRNGVHLPIIFCARCHRAEPDSDNCYFLRYPLDSKDFGHLLQDIILGE